MTDRTESSRTARVAAVLGLGAVVGIALLLGGLDVLRDGEGIEEFLTESGWVGPVAFVLAFLALQPLSLPGALLVVPATLVWPSWTVFGLSMAGGVVASTCGFLFARWLARDWVQARLSGRFLSWERRISDRGTGAVIVLRLLTGYAPAADWVLGISTVTFRQFLVGTIVGLVPGTLVLTFLGDDAVRLLERAPILVVGIGLLGGAVWWAVRRFRLPSAPLRSGGPPATSP